MATKLLMIGFIVGATVLAAVMFLTPTALSFPETHIMLNSRELTGLPRFAVGSFGLLIAGISVVFALGGAVLALVSSGILVLAILAGVGLLLLALASPLWLPPALILLIAVLLLKRRRTA